MVFEDRKEAGQTLVAELGKFKNAADIVVLGLPRGGIVTSFEISEALNLPMDLLVPRKIVAPMNKNFAIGAITENGEGYFDGAIIKMYGIKKKYIEQEIEKEKAEALRLTHVYRGDKKAIDLKGKTVILVDDGISTGASMLAAINYVGVNGASKIVVAVPTSARNSLEKIREVVDEVFCLDTPEFFGALGTFYKKFEQIEDDKVIQLMKNSNS